ncbi:MAG: NAD-dependent epimerase/dehydratase family protein, partial [Candidatus Goldbacteria bacterium]|nr:NAD-dependent epimerase/dehydratase family protein [Candidatus Goldiibacteriota bacterium]
SKLSCEYYMNVFNNLYGIETISLRYFNVFGPKQDPNSPYSAVIPKFIKAFVKNERPVIYGDGLQTRCFTYVEDIVKINILAANVSCKSSLIVNCGANVQTSINQVVHYLNKLFKKNIQPIYLHERKGEIKHILANIELLKNILKFYNFIEFSEGLKRTVNYYLSNKEIFR